MKLLLVNPNTSESVTARLVAVAQAVAPSGTTIIGATARFGARYIASRASAVVAAHALLDILAERIGASNPDAIDGVVLGCFGDPGLAAAREICPVPVTGFAEAAFEAATVIADRFTIVTGGPRWVPMLEELAAQQGLSSRLAAVLALPETGLQIMRDESRVEAQLLGLVARSRGEFGAGAVILGGAGFAGFSARLAKASSLPLIDPITAAIALATRSAPIRGPASVSGVTETDGLSPALARLLATS